MTIKCGPEERRNAVKNSKLNGIDYLEAYTSQDSSSKYNTLLFVYFFKEIPEFNERNIIIEGGVRLKNVKAMWALRGDIMKINTTKDLTNYEVNLIKQVDDSESRSVLIVRTNNGGDFSTYTLRIIRSAYQPELPPKDFDSLLSQIDFSFKVECKSDFDCNVEKECPPETLPEPIIDYMSKDYASFRKLVLDRLSLIMPGWTERNPADLGIMLVELLAHVGDNLSYFHDAVVNEAYLGTARKCISIKRHARLLDYFVHAGCNARSWVCMEIDDDADGLLLKDQTQLLSGASVDDVILNEEKFNEALNQGAEVFETMHDTVLYASHNEIWFHTWGNSKCVLPKGATSATLRNDDDQFENKLFSWDDLYTGQFKSEDLPNKLTAFLKYRLGMTLSGCVQVKKTNADKFIHIEGDDNFVSLNLDDVNSNVVLTSGDGEIFNFNVKRENNKLNVYDFTIKSGDVIIFEEINSPTTWMPEDADRLHRHAVRLTGVRPTVDLVANTSVVEITWNHEDALPFPLCLWEELGKSDNAIGEQNPIPTKKSSVARGNVVLADHGYTMLRTFEPNTPIILNDGSLVVDDGSFVEGNKGQILNYSSEKIISTEFLGRVPKEDKFRPRLSNGPLTYKVPFDSSGSASSAFDYDLQKAIPDITILGEEKTWIPQQDLLASDEFSYEFVVETENDGTASIRFGYDGMSSGKVPDRIANNYFFARYRTGNGTSGNVGAETINKIFFNGTGIKTLRNPMSAKGGVDPENMDDVRQYAPQAFLTQQRAVTESDYVDVLKRHPEVQNAMANIRWTGSWYTVFVSIDRLGGFPIDDDFKNNMVEFLNKYRLAGYDVEIREPVYVPLEIEIDVCIKLGYSKSKVEQELSETFSNGLLLNGKRGFFHPDNFTFGQPVYLSSIYEAAIKVNGIDSVTVNTFQRFGKENSNSPEKLIDISPFEIARLDNNINEPENGKISFKLHGGL